MTVTGIVDVLGRNCAFLRVTDKDLIATVGMFENHIATKEQIKEIWKGMGPK
jgi:S-adenosylhomocysteine hydrolase